MNDSWGIRFAKNMSQQNEKTILYCSTFTFFPVKTSCRLVNAFAIICGMDLWDGLDFRCGALLFMVIHVIYKYKNR